MNNENKLVPDFRSETVQTYTETYIPKGGTEQTATYKIGTAHPIISGILDKLAWVRTHVAAVWWNALEGVTLKDKIDTMDESIAQLNSKLLNPYKAIFMSGNNILDANDLPINSCGYTYSTTPHAPTVNGADLIFTFGGSDDYKAQIGITMDNVIYIRRKTGSIWTSWKTI